MHHKEFRSHCGEDSEQNLITLCTTCHTALHRYSASTCFISEAK